MLINRALIPSVILTATLVAGGCGDKSKSQGDVIAPPIMQAIKGTAASSQDFEKLLTVKRRDVAPADVNIALAKMGLQETGDGPFKWADKSSKDGNFTYTDLTTTGKDGEDVKIDTLTLTGAHMKDGNPSFDRVDIEGLNVIDDDARVNVEFLSLARPTPELGASIMRGVETIRRAGDWGKGPKLDDEDIGFGALLVDNIQITSDDANISLKSFGWGEDEDTHEAIFLLDEVKVAAIEKDGKPPMEFSLGTVSATGINMETVRKLKEESGGKEVDMSSAYFNVFDPILDSFSLKDFALSADTLTVEAPAIDTVLSRKGGTATITQNMAPVTLAFTAKPGSRDLIPVWQGLQDAGYSELEISGSAVTKLNEADDSFSVEDGSFRLKDGFEVNFDYSGHGLSAMNAVGPQGDVETALEGVSIDQVNIALKDQSFIDRAIAFAALKQKMPEMLVRMQAKGGIMFGGAYAAQQAGTPEQQAAISDMVNALNAFIDNGGTLSVGLNPEVPISAGELKAANPMELDPVRLGLSIEHK